MKIQPTATNYSCTDYPNNLSFKAYKPMGKVILTSGGIASAYIAKAFLDATKQDIVEISTVEGNPEQSKNAYNILMELITKFKESKDIKPLSREKYMIGYVEPEKPKQEEVEQADPYDDYDYLTKRIYCYSDMM